MKKLALPLALALALALALSGCTINAVAPIQANTQVDQRQGTFAGQSGQAQVVAGGPIAVVQRPSQPQPGTSPTLVPSPIPTSGAVKAEGLNFGPVKDFPPGTLIQVLNESTVVAASEKDLFVTKDGGRAWKHFPEVTLGPILSLFFTDADHGWVGGYGGTLLKLDLSGDQPHAEVQDPGGDLSVVALYFKGIEGFLCGTNGKVKRTLDGGETWDEGLSVAGRSFGNWSRFRFSTDIDGGVIFNHYEENYADQAGSVNRYVGGAYIPVEIPGLLNVGAVSVADGRAFVTQVFGAQRSKDGVWYRTDNWVDFDKIGPTLRTKKQIVRSKLSALIPVSKNLILGQLEHDMYGSSGGDYLWSEDGGDTWEDPILPNARLAWLKPFSKTKAWAWNGKTLYRSGL